MLKILNRYAHGLASVPILHALRERGCLAYFAQGAPVSGEQLAREFSANRGYLDVALGMLVSLDWIRPAGDGRFQATPGLASANVIPDRIMDLYRFPFDRYVQGEAVGSLDPWFERSERRWNCNHPYLPDYLDGLLVVPLLLALQVQGRLGIAEDKDGEATSSTLRLDIDASVRRKIEDLFVARDWGARSAGVLHLNLAGRLIVERIPVITMLASYRPMFGSARKLLFEDAAEVFSLYPGGHETHLDNPLNVIGSGFQHEEYFEVLSNMVVRCFDNEVYSSQPKYIADTGCGDGSLLRRLYETVRDRTRRGTVLDRYPLVLIAVDDNDKALAVATRTLQQVEHIVLKGDIGDPMGLKHSLRERGVEDFDRVLHVRSFLDHHRPYRQPEDRKAAEQRSGLGGGGIYIDAQGRAIPSGEMIQSTVEHLQRWSALVNQHGLIVLEAHCLSAQLCAQYLDESETFHFDASQSLSHQCLLEAETFVACAAEAGLFCPEGSWQRFPKILPFTRITLNHFEKRPYAVRHAGDQDLPALLAMPKAWQSAAASGQKPTAGIEARLRNFPEGQFVLQADGRILAFVSCDRERGNSVQLISTHFEPTVPADYVRGLLLLVEQYWALKGDIGQVCGLEECRSAMPTSAQRQTLARIVAADLAAKVAHYPFAAADDPRQGERELGEFSFRWLLASLQRMGVMQTPGETYDLDQLKRLLRVAPKYDRYFEALVRRLEAKKLVIVDGRRVETTMLVSAYALTMVTEQVAEFRESFPKRHPACAGLMNFAAVCLNRFEEIITGRVNAAEVVFPDGAMEVFAEVFCGDAVSDYFNKLVAEAVCCAMRVDVGQTGQRRDTPASKLRVLEVGAGTGGTTVAVLEAVEGSAGAIELCFSDVSPSMVRFARRRFEEKYSWIDYRILDIEGDLSKQGFPAHNYDVIVATNVLHDTRDVDFTLKQVHRLLKPGGLLILNEFTFVKDCLVFSGALLHGYWLFEDPDRRLKDSCLLGVSQWIEALERTGFTLTGSHALPTQNLDAACSQGVLLCEAKEVDETRNAPAHERISQVTDQSTGLHKAEIVEALVKQQVLTLLGSERAAAYSPHRPLMDSGLDSIELVELKSLLKERLGVKLSPEFLFEHETPQKMATALSGLVSDQQIEALLPPGSGGAPGAGQQPAGKTAAVVTGAGKEQDAIAIVGVACRLPGGVRSAESFWTLLESGSHGIVSMPEGRWRWPAFIDLRGKHKGIDLAGFLERIDEFDAAFFRTSPREAELMDPQQRLLLELGWEAMEDAGHRPSELSGRMIGVFVGVCHGDYRELMTSASDSPEAYVGTGSAPSLLANRLSYFHDFKGPSMTVDTACSSSLFALHDAVNAIRRGDCEQALVGAVNLLCTPTNSISYYRAGMLSPTGRCRTFDQAANGYVRGEGGAMLLLKPLAMALADGDSIYGLVKGTAVNHGGQASSLTAPKPGAQAAVIEAAWRAADVPLESVGYIETHGTGTSLGDPVEIGGLIEAFRRLYRARVRDLPSEPHCGIGSAKTNLGHLEGAAGLAGLIKLLLAIQHCSIPATLNFERLNPEIDLTGSPFYIAERNHIWSAPRDERGGSLPRCAGVSSFGFGGSNAHAVIAEYACPQNVVKTAGGPCLIPLSARDNERLAEQARRLLEVLEPGVGGSSLGRAQLADVAYTLQVGREAMEERVAFVVQSKEELVAALRAYVAADRTIPNCHRGHSESRRCQAGAIPVAERSREIEVSAASRDDLATLASQWAAGVEINWSPLHAPGARRRVHLPPYQFARERYWFSPPAGLTSARARPAHLHPLVHRNTSDLGELRYSSTFTGEEFFLADHRVAANGDGSQRVLPGVAYLEMARVAVERAAARSDENVKPEVRTLGTSNLAWLRPLIVEEKTVEVHVRLFPEGDDEIDFEIYSEGREPAGELEIVHCQGRVVWSREPAPARIDLEGLKRQMVHGRLEPGEYYAACASRGLIYGPTFQAITAIHQGSGQVLAQLRLPSGAGETFADYALHPSVMDGALQAAMGLLRGLSESNHPRLPFALDTLRVVSPCIREMSAWVRYCSGSQATDKVVKLDIDLCDEQGNVCVQMHGFSSRVSGQEITASAAPDQAQDQVTGALLATPVWQPSIEVAAVGGQTGYAEHHVVLCELGQAKVEKLESLLAHSQFLSLEAGQEKSIAKRYSEYALACFERIRSILQGKPWSKVLLQIVVPDHAEQAILAGLSGLLKTAALENPQLIGQVILVPAELTAEELGRCLQQERVRSAETPRQDTLTRYQRGVRQVSRWQEIPSHAEKPGMVFQDQGVYLITGGMGGLGVLFAQEILHQTRGARVVLTGRSTFSAEIQARLESFSEGWSGQASRLSYRQVDLGDLDQVSQLIAGIQLEYGQLNGILHCAGMIADNFLLKKSSVEFHQVLLPKVLGAYHLDQASRHVELDFLVLFSSIAGALGNVGQSDYASANSFLDQFAVYRNGQVLSGQRHGRTRSINWPLWQAGGMKIDAVSQSVLEQATGMRSMQTAIGLESFYRSLALPYGQMLVVEGDVAQIRRMLLNGPAVPGESQVELPVLVSAMDADSLAEKTQRYLRKQFSELLKLPVHKIDAQARLEQYGMDSILAISLTNQLEKTFGGLSKTLFFEYQTISELSAYFIRAHGARLTTLFATIENRPIGPGTRPETQPHAEAKPNRRSSRLRSSRVSASTSADTVAMDAIAIIGLSGRYPEAINIDAYWSNLREGKDCIVEVPRERWDWREYFTTDRSQSGRHYSKWGGFIAGVDEFDALFFNISPKEAKHIDPQERLFLQHAWMAVEDAGYTRASLQTPSAGQDLAGQVGVYAGLMYSEYQLFGVEASMRGNRMGIAGTTASIANRVSYVLNLHGPSMTLDTMCSSSLTAIHIACQDLKQGRTNLAIAGGVNVTLHPNKYLMLSAGQFISSEGHCQSFGEGGDGYIPGEGVGLVVLKRLSEARRDGDHIYGVIRASALTHGGRTNGYTVPNPQAQSDATSRALAEARLDARHISYIEAHGTGTRLGDPIEIAALGKAFQPYTADTGFCLIGSAKSNIGHCEAAAGIAGLTKVLLQMQHGEIVPSLHSTELNPHIDFSSTPFVVNQQLRPWEAPVLEGRTLPRVAGVSSFGAGGSNAHLIVEEYPSPIAVVEQDADVILLLSARTAEQLKQKAVDLLEFIRARQNTVDLAAMAYTLQVGREAMEERLSLVAGSVGQVAEKLEAYIEGEHDIENLYLGQVKPNQEALSLFRTDVNLRQAVDTWMANRQRAKLSDMWVKGLDLDWSKLYGEVMPKRMSLPAYPFARDRHWIETTAGGPLAASGQGPAELHPLLHSNTSDLSQQRYSSTFTGKEFFLADHQVTANGHRSQKVLPVAAYLEMARAAVEKAARPSPEALVELRSVAWAQPLVVSETKQVSIVLWASGSDEIDYEIYSHDTENDNGQEIIHCQGRVVWSCQPFPARLDLNRLQAEMDASQILARLPSAAEETFADYVLHPSVLEGALQAGVGFVEGLSHPAQPWFACALQSLQVISPCTREMFAWVRYCAGRQATDEVVNLDIDLCDEQGNIAVQLRGVSLQPATVEADQAAPAMGKGITLAGVRKEIVLVAYNQVIPAPVERKKPTSISLLAPSALAWALDKNTIQRVPVMLSSTQASAAAPSVRLFDCGNGIFAIQAGVSASRDIAMVNALLQALGRVQQEPSLKVLMLSGIERCFLQGGREEYNEAVGQGLYQAIVSFPYPVMAVVAGDAIGAGFLAAALCDFMVCREDARYGYTDPQRHFYPTTPEAVLFSERFGAVQAQDFLYMSGTAWTGRQLRTKGWTCPIVAEVQFEAYSEQLASRLAAKSQAALGLLKQHLTRRLVGLVHELTPVEAAAPAIEMRPERMAASSQHLHLESLQENILVIRFQVAELNTLLADLGFILARRGQLGGYKAIVLVSESAGFLPATDPAGEGKVLELRHLLMELEIPVIAALAGNAAGLAWLISQFCDACVYSRTGIYSSAGMGQSQAQTAATLFTHRFGDDAGREILLTGADYSGGELQQRAPAVLVAEHDRVLPTAIKVAEFWATLPRAILAGWKQHTAATIEEKMRNLPAGWEKEDEAPVFLATAPRSIPLQSTVVTATAHPGGIVVVRMEDRQAKNMFSDALMAGVTEAFVMIERTPAFKVVVLTGYESYFASGGTRESLLAIQAGKAKFTDNKVFQAALDCRLPVIAAMQGHGIGAGWSLGMFADLVLLSEESQYVSPYMNYGFTPGAGATLILADKIGHDLARESLLTGEPYPGSDLKARGLRLAIVPRAELFPAAMRLAGQIAQQSRGRLIGLKQQLSQYLHQSLPQTYQLELVMHDETFVGHPETLRQIQTKFHQQLDKPPTPPKPVKPSVAPASTNQGDLLAEVTASLKILLAEELQMRDSDIAEHVQLVDLGLDSISGVTWVRKINQKFDTTIEATKIYSYPTLSQLSRYVKEQAELQGTLSRPSAPAAAQLPDASSNGGPFHHQLATRKLTSWRSRSVSRFTSTPATEPAQPSQAIAVIGMAGQFPQARNLEEFWQNIAQGRNCITPIAERWDVNAYYQPGGAVAGKSNSQWLGALEEYDRFDPLFFNLSPAEAESMDPQQRLFLEACWHSIENAGYDARLLSGSKCGVFVGCTNADYHQLSRQHQLSAQGFTGGAMSILAARISYFLNLQGCCLAIDTACSSSLVAITHACDSLTSGGSDLALAGGVYVMAGPELHIKTAQAGMLSPEGKCFTFDQRADGFVPGEGVGVVLLKRLADAEKDRDIIHGVIRGWGVNQDGKTNGITAPNPESQTRLEQGVYDKYRIDPANIQLIEAHGTGTKLGDPIEVEALKTSFKKYTQNKDYCALGSVKSNIGHCVTAAGIAGFIKLLLALKHKQLPPTINFEQLNEHIDLKDSPFYVNSRLQEWKLTGAEPRQAAISSFGFSGTNAHMVIGEYVPPAEVNPPVFAVTQNPKVIVPLSAKRPEQLQQKVRDLLDFVRKESLSTDVIEIAYTLQVGREAMDERLGLVVSSVEQLAEKLEAYIAGEQRIEDAYEGQVQRSKESLSFLSEDDDLKNTIVDKLTAQKKLSRLAELWVKGLELDWSKLYGEVKPRRISLPAYPFAKERYWIDTGVGGAVSANGASAAVLHPLLHRNTSDMSEQRYSSTFRGEEFFLTDHRVRANGHGSHQVLPGVAYLEMARAAIEQAWPRPWQGGILELHDTVWARPMIVSENKQVSIALRANDNDNGQLDYEIYSQDGEQQMVHCRGWAVWSAKPAPVRLDLEQLKRDMQSRVDASSVYAAFTQMGLHYGPAHRGITALYVGQNQLLAELRLPASVATSQHQFVLHPSLMDCALQASVGLLVDVKCPPSKPLVPFLLGSLRVISACPGETTAWVRFSDQDEREDRNDKVDIDVCDGQGNVCVQMRSCTFRILEDERGIARGGTFVDEPTHKDDCPFHDDDFYRKLIADIANREVSVDEAVALG